MLSQLVTLLVGLASRLLSTDSTLSLLVFVIHIMRPIMAMRPTYLVVCDIHTQMYLDNNLLKDLARPVHVPIIDDANPSLWDALERDMEGDYDVDECITCPIEDCSGCELSSGRSNDGAYPSPYDGNEDVYDHDDIPFGHACSPVQEGGDPFVENWSDPDEDVLPACMWVWASTPAITVDDIHSIMVPGLGVTDDHYTYISMHDGDILRLDKPVNLIRDADWFIMDTVERDDVVMLIDSYSRIHITTQGMTTVYAQAVSVFI